MPNDAQINFGVCLSSLEELLNGHEDAVFSTTKKDHLNLLKSLDTVLSNKVEVSPTDADRVHKICLRYITDVRCVLNVFSIISELIDIHKDNPLLDFLPSALAILKFLNTQCLEDNASKLRILSLQVLMKYPKSTLQILIRHHSENIIQLVIGQNQAADLPSKIESLKLLTVLEWLPPYEKRLFVEAGTSLWLAGVIPALMQIVVSAEDVHKIESCLSYTEMLAKELVLQHYSQNPHWKTLLENTANPKMYPASVMGLLENGKDYWHRIWILLIKLLKNHVTRSCVPYTSPINAMLPIVETAFKKESAQRVRAFACWNELIESFCNESLNCMEKRIKLLIIPLKLYNTKTEETVLAKFQTWWHFIQKFRLKIEKFTNEILISFLHFMFGKHQSAKQFQANMASVPLREKCIEAFAEIMHVDCSNCHIMDLKPLDGPIITTILLTDYWKDFVYAQKSCIWAVAQRYTMDTKIQIQCIWMSFVMRLAAMAENTLRQDMFDDLINLVSELISENKQLGNEHLIEIIVDDITLPLWRDNKLKTLTKSRNQTHRPMHRIVKLIMDDQFNNYFKRFKPEELTRLLQPLIGTILEEAITNPVYIFCLLDELLVTNNTLVIWTALAQASMESKLCVEVFYKILIWPFKTVHVSFEVKEAAEAWYNLYNTIHEHLEKTDFYNEISKVLTRPVEDSKASNYFVLFALIGVLKHKPDEAKMAKLEALTYEMNDYNGFEQLLKPLVNTVVLMLNNSTDENLAQITINCVENILKAIKSETETIGSKSSIQNSENTFSNLRASIPEINKTMLSDTILSTLKTYLEKCTYQSINKQVRSLLYLYQQNVSPKKVNDSPKKVSKSPEKTPFLGWDIHREKFALPKNQELKKSKNKGASIETTFVENGEEYVVVKSNWKFNPKKLTENQKEKLQRRRDIPALYQDLSQSQDEIKLTSWKTDSQDTSLSSSKSATSNDVSDTLKQIPNSEIVSKIIENIYDTEKDSQLKIDTNASRTPKVKTTKAEKLSTPGEIKSPRMALKDRVYRNVRNLIGNARQSDNVTDRQDTNILQNVSNQVKPLSKPELVCIESRDKNAESNEISLQTCNDDVITIDKQKKVSPVTSPANVSMKNVTAVVSTQRIDKMIKLVCTPLSKAQNEMNLQFSAPQTSVERPARMKRTPKKYDDTLLIQVKKKRYSKNDSQSNSQDLLECHPKTVIAQIHNPNDKMDITDNLPENSSPNETDKNENAQKCPTATEDVIILQNATSCVTSDDTSHKDTEKSSLISPKTSINKPIVKSPEKPSTGEVPSSFSKASEGVDNDAAQKETFDVKDKPNVATILTKQKELQKTPTKEVAVLLTPININKEVLDTRLLCKLQEAEKTSKKLGAQNELITNQMDTPNKSPVKSRKSNAIKKYTDNDENAVSTTVEAYKDLNQNKLSAKKTVLLLCDMDKNVEKVEKLSTPIHKTKKDSDTCLLSLNKPQEPQKTPITILSTNPISGAQNDELSDQMDSANLSPRKLGTTNVQIEISAHDENTAVNTPFTADKDLNHPKLSAKKTVLVNKTDKNVEKVGVAATLIDKNKKDLVQDTSLPPLNKLQEPQNTPKNVGARQDVETEQMETPNIFPKKFKKTKVLNEIIANDENAAVNTPVTADKDLFQPKLSAKKTVILNDTDKNVEVHVISTSINKTKENSDTSPPLSKLQEPQNTPKNGGARYDVITDSPNKSTRKFRTPKRVQKETSAKDENAALNTAVTTDEDLNQSKLSPKKRDIQDDTGTNVEKVNKTKKDSVTTLVKSAKKSVNLKYSHENKTLSNTLVNTKDGSQDKLTQKEAYDVTENNKNKGNLMVTPKAQRRKTSRIEKELAIDMVEGHPFLKSQSESRITRKKLMEVRNGSKRKTIDRLNKSKHELTPKTTRKYKKSSPSGNSTLIVVDSQDKAQNTSPQKVMDEPPSSEDVIESSQDSTMTTISVKAKRQTPKRLPVVALEKISLPVTQTQDLLQYCNIQDEPVRENHENTDIELPQNKSVESNKNVIDLTENMDTEPIEDSINLTENMDTEPLVTNVSDDVIIVSETVPTPLTLNSESEPMIGQETQELAEADTQPNDPKQFEEWEINKPLLTSPNSNPQGSLAIEDNDITQSLLEAALLANTGETTEASSPFKDDDQRKQDFLNNTVEISPIKVQSPDRQKESPPRETNKDFVVIQLSSPVHSNGEPFDQQCSPEFFTEDKVSPDKQNASPPRVEVTITNSSPSSSLSLKKNRAQANRPCSGRAAHMLGLLSVSTDLKNKKLPPKKALRALYHFKNTENDCSVEQNAGTEENFLQLQRSLPTVTSSPSGPILKRKLVEITDDSTASPASKRKRVSFHDPPVSTTVSVQKYIEPISLMRSPQPSKKRQTRAGVKSPKKLDNAFLDSALSKTVESFTETTTPSDETENISLDVTPAVEIVKTSELNDTDPICPDLIDCTDPIDVIAVELSCAAMRDLFVKELEGKVDTVGDLAKMTELEVNRLCIKAPKITVAKKVLTDYITNRPGIAVVTVIEEAFSEPMTESILHESKVDVEMQTDETEVSNKSTQVTVEQVTSAETQTEVVVSASTSVQTNESGCKTTEEIIDSCMSEREDFFEKFKQKLTDDQVQSIAGLLSEKTLLQLLMKNTDATTLIQRILKKQSKGIPKCSKPSAELTFLRELLLEKYETADLGLFCTNILQKIFHEPA